MEDRILELVDRGYDEMISIRRHLHRHPEISYQEHETTKFIKKTLDELGIPHESPLETGCVGILQGGRKSDRVIALRADIDALAMDEEGEHKKAFASENPGAAHCCGHDAHTANLLGTARILSELEGEIEGKVLLIFQPGEEKLPGGGRLLCETGFLQNQGVQHIYGLHTSPEIEPGKIAIKTGELMAAPDEFEIEIIGRGGHAAKPHEATDPIVIAAQFINAVQSIVSRSVDPTEKAVVTVGQVTGGTAHNIIPEKVKLLGTVRTFSVDTAERIKNRLESILKGITQAHQATYTFAFNKGYPAVLNSEKEANAVVNTSKRLLGEASIQMLDRPIMAGEDFAFYQKEFPGAFFFLGSGSEEADSKYTWHHPRYNVDERCFKTGAAIMAGLALKVY